ncbi:MAG: class I SAM-dependent RNA methyltransferase [Pseudomonadota bacterium]
MSEATLVIEALGAQGDGIARLDDQPIYIPYTLPGETVLANRKGAKAQLARIEQVSPDRVDPACPHFGPRGQKCGGCSLQHMERSAYNRWKRQRVVDALMARGIETDVAALVACPVGSRRRAVFSAFPAKSGLVLGFNQAATNTVIDIRECTVLLPGIVAALPPLKRLAVEVAGRKPFRLNVLSTASGLEVRIEGRGNLPDRQRQSAIERALQMDLARLSLDDEILIETRKPVLSIDGIDVAPPPGSFFQATEAAQNKMIDTICGFLSSAGHIADLFSGCGTFSLPLARRSSVHAVESDGPALAAASHAVRHTQGLKPLTTDRRDLFRSPLTPGELKKTDAVVFDPPRAGAQAQAQEIANSGVQKVAAVSCNPATLARDLRILIDGGYRLLAVTPIDQFLWSHHVEAIALLER